MKSICASLAIAAALVILPVTLVGAIRGDLKGYQVFRSPDSTFVVFYPPRFEKTAREVEKLIGESAGEIAGELGLEESTPIKVILASDAKTYTPLHGGQIPEWSIAFSDVERQVLGINVDLMARNPRSFPTVVRHELSHLLLAQRVHGAPMPTWFMEGLAMMQAGEWGLSEEWRLTTMAAGRDVPYLEELRGPFPRSAARASLCYALSYLAVEDLFRDRPEAILTLTAFIRDTGNFESAFESTFGMSTYDFAGRLYVEVDRRYRVPGTILNALPYWLGATLLFVAVYAVKRERNRRKLERWEEEEARQSRL
jgi:hypothetical protein